MKLEDFVSEALLQVIGGVQKAQKGLQGQNSTAQVNPSIYYKNEDVLPERRNGPSGGQVISMKFDVSVTVADEAETGANIGIVVGSIRLGATGKSGESNSMFSRIQFEIPMVLPVQ